MGPWSRWSRTPGSQPGGRWVQIPLALPNINITMKVSCITESITRDEKSEYGESECATLAYYLSLQLKKPIGIIESSAQDFIHAFVVLDKNTGIDIFGRRPIKDIVKDELFAWDKKSSVTLDNTPEELDRIAFVSHGKSKFLTGDLIPRLIKT